MIAKELLDRVGRLIYLTYSFALISLVNGIVIRVAIRTSICLNFLIIAIEDNLTRSENQRIANRRRIYRYMGNIGAESAYLDRIG